MEQWAISSEFWVRTEDSFLTQISPKAYSNISWDSWDSREIITLVFSSDAARRRPYSHYSSLIAQDSAVICRIGVICVPLLNGERWTKKRNAVRWQRQYGVWAISKYWPANTIQTNHFGKETDSTSVPVLNQLTQLTECYPFFKLLNTQWFGTTIANIMV